MPHTNSTTNYSLPQFITTDKPAWLTDVNSAYSAIDMGMHNAQVAADAAQADATQALDDAAAAAGAATTANSKASGAVASIAENFDATATYSVGDYVMYNNLLYICTTAIVTPGPWTGSTNWSRTTVDNILPRIASDISYSNSSSSLTATNVQGAIDELAGRITYEDVTITTGETQYFGFYFGDAAIASSGKTIIGIIPYSQTANKPFFASRLRLGDAVRAWSTDPAIECVVRVVYLT